MKNWLVALLALVGCASLAGIATASDVQFVTGGCTSPVVVQQQFVASPFVMRSFVSQVFVAAPVVQQQYLAAPMVQHKIVAAPVFVQQRFVAAPVFVQQRFVAAPVVTRRVIRQRSVIRGF